MNASLHSPVVLDVAGLTLSTLDRERLAHPLTGGVILFARNWQDRAQLRLLCAQIKEVREDLLIAVDHEGGRVQRFKSDGMTHLPAMAQLGRWWMRDGGMGETAMQACDIATACGYVLGAELRACGVDFSFTPVLDLNFGASSVIGDRAWHRDARVTTVLAKSLMMGLLQAGMSNCGKHFPGHGYVQADSHVASPVDERPLAAIMAEDIKPYAWLSSVLSSVMPAHVSYPKVDALPAGFSKRWLQDILRHELGFQGAIFSDDLSMQGAAVAGDHTQAAIAALNAGCDLVLLCNQSLGDGHAVDALLSGLSVALAGGHWQPSAASEARRLDLLPTQAPLEWESLMRHGSYIHALEKIALL